MHQPNGAPVHLCRSKQAAPVYVYGCNVIFCMPRGLINFMVHKLPGSNQGRGAHECREFTLATNAHFVEHSTICDSNTIGYLSYLLLSKQRGECEGVDSLHNLSKMSLIRVAR